MFIGRENELKALENMYNSDRFEFVVIYGRRRIGKTALINEFIKDKKAIYFTGVESNSKQNLENFSRCIMEFDGGNLVDAAFSLFQTALEYVFKRAENERIILTIDEYPYVAHASKSLPSTLQFLIDKYKDNSKLMLILCGSSMSYMEDHVLAYKSPLYGRRTAQIKMLPFSFDEASHFLTGYSNEDKAVLYGMFGGTPQYLTQINNKVSVEENVKNTYLNPRSFIFEEPVNLLKQEVREPALYTAVITAVSEGATKLSEICGKVGEETNVVSVYIKNLVELGIIQKEFPYGEENSKKAVYSIADNMFRFWYRFVPENMSLIARGGTDIVYNRIRPDFSDFMGSVFEDICTQYLWKQMISGNVPVYFKSLGRWWGGNPKTKSQEEIDIMGSDKQKAIFAECKWTNEKVDSGVLETLANRSELFAFTEKHFYLFAKTGFTKGCMENAEKLGNVTLVTLGEMC